MGFKSSDTCLEKARDDEPIFVLLGRDPIAANIVREWAMRAVGAGHQSEKIGQALLWANEMERYEQKSVPGK